MNSIVDIKFGHTGFGSLIYPVGILVFGSISLFMGFNTVMTVAEDETGYSVTTAFTIASLIGLWFTLGGIRGGYQCFKVIQRAEVDGSSFSIRTFSHSKAELDVDDISSIRSFSAKPAMSLLAHDSLNYLITLQDGARYVISGRVEGAEDFLKKLHTVNPEISLSLAEKGFRNHWTLEPK